MELTTIFGGVIVSFLTQFIKTKSGTNTLLTQGLVIGLSILGGAVYTYFVSVGYWDAFIGILANAALTYNLIIKNWVEFGKVE